MINFVMRRNILLVTLVQLVTIVCIFKVSLSSKTRLFVINYNNVKLMRLSEKAMKKSDIRVMISD